MQRRGGEVSVVVLRKATAALVMVLAAGLLVLPLAAPRARADARPEMFTTLSDPPLGRGSALGLSLDRDGDYAVVGAPGEQDGRGAAYVYRFDADRSITRVGKLQASDGQAGDAFGSSVSIDGSTIVVGAYNANARAGAAYVFMLPDGGWPAVLEQTAKLTAAASAYLGYSVAVSGNTIAVGDYGYNGTAGAVRVWVKPLLSGWVNDGTPTQTMTAGDSRAGDELGWSVDISGGTIVAGAPRSRGRGAAYVFSRALLDQWPATQTAKLTSSTGADGDGLGSAVATDGSTVVAGAPSWQTDGAAFVYERPAGGWDHATQTGRLTPPEDVGNDAAGEGVAINGSNVLVGARGLGQRGGVMNFPEPGDGWHDSNTPSWQVTPSGNPLDAVGSVVAGSDDYLLLGWPREENGGAVIVYGFPGFSAVPLRLAFPDATLGATSEAKTVTVSNPGTAALIPALSITGAHAADFRITGTTCAPSVSPTGTCTVTTTFAPTAVGDRAAFLQFDDLADGNPQRIPLSGTGTAAPTPTPDPGPGPAPEPVAKPTAPRALVVTPRSRKVKVRWRAGVGADDYRVVVRGKKPTVSRTATTASLRKTVKGLKAGKRYRVCVRSHNEAGLSKKVCRATRTRR